MIQQLSAMWVIQPAYVLVGDFKKRGLLLGEKEDHHFIPRLLLRNWSDNGKQINLILFKSDGTIQTIYGSPIKSSFKEKRLYGKSSKYETTLFAENIEAQFRSAIDELKITKCMYDKRIQSYILYQMCRTKFIVDMCSHNVKIISDICFDKDKALKVGVSKSHMAYLIEDEQGHNIGYEDALENIILPAINPFVCSLRKQKLIYSDVDLFIGENPVIVICPLDKPELTGSILDPCSMILFPISPNEVVVLYRPEECEIKDDYRLDEDEAYCFNSFQIQQTDRYIAFKNNFDEEKYKYDFKNGYDHKTMTLSNGLQFFHTWQDLHYSGLDSCFQNIFYQKGSANGVRY